MCDKLERKVKQDCVDEFFVNASFVTKRSFLRFIRDHPYHKQITHLYTQSSITYQKAHLYYAFTEDIYPMSRIAPDFKYLGMKNLSPCLSFSKEFSAVQDFYSEHEAINHYLRSYSANFAIFGKPGLNSIGLALALANIWNCVLISPASLIRQEIDAGTEKGRYMEETLRNGGCLDQEIVMNLIRCRIKMRDVKHRGYVVEGLPLIPNNFDYLSRSRYSLDMDDICARFCEDTTCKIYKDRITSLQDQSLFQNSDCKLHPNYEREIPEQINEMFSIWSRKPTLIIYMICPKEDVANIRSQQRIEAETGNIIKNAFTTQLLNNKIEKDELNNMFDFYEIPKEWSIISNDQKNHLLRRIFDMKPNIQIQCDLYEQLALPIIDKWILTQNPQYVIRVDGRDSMQQILELVNMRLCVLALQRPILPKRIIKQGDDFLEKFSVVDSEGKLIEKSVEEIFLPLTRKDTVSSEFYWKLSTWKFYCPVELARGRTIKGFSKYAVRFLNKIFFLSSKEAENLFIENPRTFLLPPNPRPTCKIALFGPNYAGKTKISERLAKVFCGTVININEIVQDLIKRRIDEKISDVLREMRENVIHEMEEGSKTKNEITERMKLADFLAWYIESIEVFNRLTNLLKISRFDNHTEEYDKQLENIRLKLQSLGLAQLENEHFLKQIKFKESLLYDGILQVQSFLARKSSIPKLSGNNNDIVQTLQECIKHIYDKSIDISIEDKAEFIIENIKRIPDEELEDGLFRDGGYVIDGMYTDIEVWQKIVHDSNIVFEDLILLFENEPYVYLLDTFRKFSQLDDSVHKTSYTQLHYENFEISHTDKEQKYLEHLKYFQLMWTNFEEQLPKFEGNLLKCNLTDIEDVTEYVINHINHRFSAAASIKIKENNEQEESLEATIADIRNLTNNNIEEEKRKDKVSVDTRKYQMSNDIHPLGDSSYYCPVALSSYNVCWRGKDEHTVFFMDKAYLLSSAKALTEFLNNPTKFSIPFLKLKFSIPPLRIAIVGPPGSGKTRISEIISREYGMAHINYFDNFTEFIKERVMVPFIRKDTPILINNNNEQIELPIDLNDERYNSHEPTVRSFLQKYWETGSKLPSKMLQECLLAFYKSPYNQCGIILDGFPSCVEDVEAAIANYAVPEIIIELHCSLQTSLDRMVPILFTAWKKRVYERERIKEERHISIPDGYLKQPEDSIETSLRQQRQFQTINHSEMTEDSVTSVNLGDQDYYKQIPNTVKPNKFLHEQNLQSIEKFIDLEDFEIKAKKRITQETVTLYKNYVEKLLAVRNILKNESIPWIDIDAENTEKIVSLHLLSLLDAFVFRNNSMLEQTYIINLETAEGLLDCGYYFLSSFGRWCPVQIYINKTPIQMFLAMKARSQIFPVIHRQYIYFLAGKEALSAFIENPLKYLSQEPYLPPLPLRISIIGPPKCGKTTLANRFAKTYGMEVITPGKALRYMLKNYNWTESARMAEDQLRTGQTVSIDLIARAIEMFSLVPRAASQGYILDGCPLNRKESEQLILLGIQPMIVLDLKADLQFCLECLSWDRDKKRKPSNFSVTFLSRCYANWQTYQASFRDWLKKFSRNVIELDATRSKWNVWTRADHIVRSQFADIILYYREADFDKVHSLKYMCVSPFEFQSRQSSYKSYCPVCLSREDISKIYSQLTDSREMVQYREYFYWICLVHLHAFVKNPSQYLPPINIAFFPDEQPRLLRGFDMKHICWTRPLRADGLCLVTYVENLPDRKLMQGKNDLAVSLKSNIYLFCSEECRHKFLIDHNKYSKFDIKFPLQFLPIEVQSLPDLGFLEQIIAKIIIEAVNHIAVHRPKIVGLSPAISAIIYIGIYLKIHNVSKNLKEANLYKYTSKQIAEQNQIIKAVTDIMKKKINPYVSLPRYFTIKLDEQSSSR